MTQNGSRNADDFSSDSTPPTNGQRTERVPDEPLAFNWNDIVDLFRRNVLLIVGITVLVTGAAALYSFSLPYEYETTSVVSVETKSSLQQQRPDIFRLGTQNQSLMNEIANLRLSYELRRRVASRLRKAAQEEDAPELPIVWSNSEPAPSFERMATLVTSWFGAEPPTTSRGELLPVEAITGRLAEQISFSALDEELDIIQISAWSTSPEEAHTIATVYVEEYQERSKELSRSNITSSREFLSNQLEKARADLQEAEARLQSYMVENRAVALEQGAGSVVEQIANLDAIKDETQMQLELERAALDSLQNRIREIRPRLADRVASGVDSKLNSLQQAKADLEMRKEEMLVVNPSLQEEGNSTPELRKINSQLENLTTQIQQLSKKYVKEVTQVGGIEGNSDGRGLSYFTELTQKAAERRVTISGLEAKLKNVNDRIREHEQRLQEIPAQMMDLAELKREKQSAERLFTTLQKQLQETKIAAKTSPDYVDVLTAAQVPQMPVRPLHARNIGLGFLAGLLLACLAAAGRSMIDYSIEDPQDLRDRGYRVLGVIPEIASNGTSELAGETNRPNDHKVVLAHDPESPAAEAYRGLRMGVRFIPTMNGEEIRSVVVTSPGAGQGKSLTSANLALSLAKTGKSAVLVDGDLRRPQQHRIFGVPREPGLTDLLDGLPENVVHEMSDVHESLHLITAGRHISSPGELMESGQIYKFLAQLKDTYDYVVFDTPPVLAVTDAALLARICDTTTLVIDQNQSDYRALKHTVDKLEEVGATIGGIVLNRFDLKKAQGYDQYHYGYSSEYEAYQDAGEAA